MRYTHHLVSALILPALLGACGGGADSIGFFGDDGAPGAAGAGGANALVAVSAEAAGANCAAGGSKIEAGMDTDRDGTLAASEVSSTQYVCNGAAGAAGNPGTTGAAGSNGLNALVQMLDEPSGGNCVAGGKAIKVGVDGNANGVLDANEISSTGYVCGGTNGSNGTNGVDGANGTNGLNSLLSITNEPSGANCIYGGNKVSSGLDSNANSMLDVIEVSTTSYVCNGATGASLYWINVAGTGVVQFWNTRPNVGYIASDDTFQVTLNLPRTDDSITAPDPNIAAIGDVLRVTGAGTAGWKIAQGAGQSVHTASLGGAASTSPGFAGFISGGASDAIELLYIGGGLWVVLSHSGNLTVQ